MCGTHAIPAAHARKARTLGTGRGYGCAATSATLARSVHIQPPYLRRTLAEGVCVCKSLSAGHGY